MCKGKNTAIAKKKEKERHLLLSQYLEVKTILGVIEDPIQILEKLTI